MVKRHILIVEDDDVSRQVAVEIVRRAGWQVRMARNGAEGLEAARSADFQVVLMDLHMPGMDGVEVLQRIRSLPDPSRAQVPVILLSADVTPRGRDRAMEAGANAYLTKPFDRPALLSILEDVTTEAVFSRPPVNGAEAPEVSTAVQSLDHALLEERLASLGPGPTGQIIALYLSSAPRLAARVAAAATPLEGQREAHTLRGASAVVGARRVALLAGQVERSMAQGLMPEGHPLASLAEGVTESLEALRLFCTDKGISLP